MNISDSTISTIAGTGVQSYSGDGGAAISAELDLAHGVSFDRWGNLYITDYGNNRIRKMGVTTGVTTLKQQGSLSIYPNPASEEIYIQASGFNTNHATLEVIDIRGRTIMEKDITNVYSPVPINLDISGLSAGLYFVVLKNSSQQLTAKIVKE